MTEAPAIRGPLDAAVARGPAQPVGFTPRLASVFPTLEGGGTRSPRGSSVDAEQEAQMCARADFDPPHASAEVETQMCARGSKCADPGEKETQMCARRNLVLRAPRRKEKRRCARGPISISAPPG
jgi:hypothetical protein